VYCVIRVYILSVSVLSNANFVYLTSDLSFTE
jgi:hypothetical protein